MTDGGPDREWINVADALSVMARQSPDRTAVVFPSGTAEARLSFVELDRLSESFAAGFERAGLRQGDRTLVFIPPGQELIATAQAVKLHQVAPHIDTGVQMHIHRVASERTEKQACRPNGQRLSRAGQG